MIRDLHIEGFRALRELHLTGLGRVNLLVGANNSGKTSVLEAIAFLASGGDPWELHDLLERRGEIVFDDANDDFVDVRHVFFGRKIGDGAALSITATQQNGEALKLHASTPRVPKEELADWRALFGQPAKKQKRRNDPRAKDIERRDQTPRYLRVTLGPTVTDVPLHPNGGFSHNEIHEFFSAFTSPLEFLATKEMDDEALVGAYEEVLLTPEEALVIGALQEIEPQIVRLATRQSNSFRARSFVVGMEGADEPVPLGSLGDGIHRMLAVAIALVAARGGYLLVDEIDTGLHHTVMRKLWRLVEATARRLDVTVFATTHSYDCVHALAEIAKPGADVSLIRIERDNPNGIHFSPEEIQHLAEWQIEAR